MCRPAGDTGHASRKLGTTQDGSIGIRANAEPGDRRAGFLGGLSRRHAGIPVRGDEAFAVHCPRLVGEQPEEWPDHDRWPQHLLPVRGRAHQWRVGHSARHQHIRRHAAAGKIRRQLSVHDGGTGRTAPTDAGDTLMLEVGSALVGGGACYMGIVYSEGTPDATCI